MSDSLSSADRDARIATIADIERRADYGSGNLTGHVVWLCAELRASLAREEEAETRVANMLTRADLAESACAATCNLYGAALNELGEAKKDAERLNWLEQAVASADHEGGRCVVVIGAWYSSDTPSPDGYSVNVGELHVDPNEWANLREAIDCARSVSLSENG